MTHNLPLEGLPWHFVRGEGEGMGALPQSALMPGNWSEPRVRLPFVKAVKGRTKRLIVSSANPRPHHRLH